MKYYIVTPGRDQSKSIDKGVGIMIIKWTGVAISENERLRPGRMPDGRPRWYSTNQYKAFLNSLIWGLKGKWGNKTPLKALSVELDVWINPRMDAHNVEKACFDALQQAGVVVNDNKILHHGFTIHKKESQLDVIVFKIESYKMESD